MDARSETTLPPGSGPRRASLDRRVLLIVWPFLVVVALLVALDMLRADVLSSVRSYVGGESLWSKAEKDAVQHLLRYAQSHDAADLAHFERTIRIPLGDRAARLALDRTPPDVATARRGFVEGGNDARDIEGMIRLYRNFSWVDSLGRVIRIWTEGDAKIAGLVDASHQLQRAIALGEPESVGPTEQRIRTLDAELTPLEQQFSATLGEASHDAQRIMNSVMVGASLALVLAGLYLSQRMLRRGDAVEEALRLADARCALSIASGAEAARALRSLQVLLTAAPAAFIAWNARDGVILWSDAAETLFGIRRDEAIGRALPHGLSAVVSLAHRASRTDEGDPRLVGVSLDLFDQRGRPLPSTTSISRLRAGEPGADTFVAVIEDLTPARLRDQRNVEARLAERDAMIRRVHEGVATHLHGIAALLRQRPHDTPRHLPAIDAAVTHVLTIAAVHAVQGERRDGGGGSVALATLVDRLGQLVSGITHVSIVLSGSFARSPGPRLDEARAVPFAMVLSALLTNAVMHRAHPTAHDVIEVELRTHVDGCTVVVSNAGRLPAGFDFAAGTGLGNGLERVRSLLPERGMQLSVATVGAYVIARLVVEAAATAGDGGSASAELALAD